MSKTEALQTPWRRQFIAGAGYVFSSPTTPNRTILTVHTGATLSGELEWGREAADLIERAVNNHDELVEMLETVLLRLDLEAQEKGEGAVFMLAAVRTPIRKLLEQAKGDAK